MQSFKDKICVFLCPGINLIAVAVMLHIVAKFSAVLKSNV